MKKYIFALSYPSPMDFSQKSIKGGNGGSEISERT
jgi:hypothetical protein